MLTYKYDNILPHLADNVKKKTPKTMTKLNVNETGFFDIMHKTKEEKGRNQMNIFKNGKNSNIKDIFTFIPASLCSSIEREAKSLPFGENDIYEIRLRAEGRSGLVTSLGVITLPVRLSYDDIANITARLTGGSLYAHRDTITKGYISARGIRVGVCGRARYEGGELIGVSEIRSLVFRITHGICELENELFALWREGVGHGLLIYSPPLGGKTTAIRRLAARIGESGVRTCIVDERCEFSVSDYSHAEVEILRGYEKAVGIEIAVRTLGAEVVVVDEIGASEVKAVSSALMMGVPLIATAHASSDGEILTGGAFSALRDSRTFDTLAGIIKTPRRRILKCTRIKATEPGRGICCAV